MDSQFDTMRQQQAERLELIREQTGMIQLEFAKYLDLEPGSYSDIKRGKNGISKNVLRKLEKKLNINIEWIMTGNGSMSLGNSEVENTLVAEKLNPYKLHSSEGMNLYVDKLFKIIERRDEQIERLLVSNRELDYLLKEGMEKIMTKLNENKL